MVYLVGVLGFISGFLFGQMILRHMLRGSSQEEILEMMKDSGARWRYGAINWLFALLGAACLVWMYNRYFF